jgi:hypothetical protein
MQTDNFVMRSQLDCQDDRLPGTGVFDIKTRACISLRMDILNYEVLPAPYFICASYVLIVDSHRKIQGI